MATRTLGLTGAAIISRDLFNLAGGIAGLCHPKSESDAKSMCNELQRAFPTPTAPIAVPEAKQQLIAALKVCIKHLEAK